MDNDPANRFQTAASMRHALEELLDVGVSTPGSATSPVTQSPRGTAVPVRLASRGQWTLHGDRRVLSVALSASGRYLASGSADDRVAVIDPLDPEARLIAEVVTGANVTCLDFAADEEFLLAGDDKGQIHLLDLKTGESRRTTIPRDEPATGVRCHPVWSGRRRALLSTAKGRVFELEIRDDDKVFLAEIVLAKHGVTAVGWSPDASSAFACDRGGFLWRHDFKDKSGGGGRGTPSIASGPFVGADHTSLAVSPDGRHVASGDAAGVIRVVAWERDEQPQPVARLQRPGVVLAMRFSPTGDVLYFGDNEGFVGMWPWKTPETPAEFRHAEKGLKRTVYGLAMTANGRHLVSCGWDSIVRSWEVEHAPRRR